MKFTGYVIGKDKDMFYSFLSDGSKLYDFRCEYDTLTTAIAINDINMEQIFDIEFNNRDINIELRDEYINKDLTVEDLKNNFNKLSK